MKCVICNVEISEKYSMCESCRMKNSMIQEKIEYNGETLIIQETSVMIQEKVEDRALYSIEESISKINNDSIVVIDNQFNYEITHFESEVKLYAYIKSNDSLGYCEDYYVIYSDNINYIAKRLTIYYEKI